MATDSLPRIAIVTGEQAPELTENGQALLTELRERGFTAEPVVWTDEGVNWTCFDAVLVRSCWEYYTQPDAFRTWLRLLEERTVSVLNPPEVIRWNLHKFYLRDLADSGVPTLPTVWVEQSDDRDLLSILQSNGWQSAVVKPAIGTSSADVWRTSVTEASGHQQRFEALTEGSDALVQEFAAEIADGEQSLVFFRGRLSHATRCHPAEDDFRAHPNFGGTSQPYDPPQTTVEKAREMLHVACGHLELTPADLSYARVDGIERGGEFLLMELELIEPYLSLDATEGAVAAFADAIEVSLCKLPSSPSSPAVSDY